MLAAILASRMVAQQNILARERAPLKRNVYVFDEPYDRRRVNGESGGMYHVAVVLFDARDAFENHHNRAPLRAHVDWLKGSVQD